MGSVWRFTSILVLMPTYVRGFFMFPKFLLKTYNIYLGSSRIPILENGKVEEVLSSFNTLVCDPDENENPYSMVRESQ